MPHCSSFYISSGSIDKLPQHVTINESPTKGTVTFITKKVVGVDSSDKAIQTDARSYIQALKTGVRISLHYSVGKQS